MGDFLTVLFTLLLLVGIFVGAFLVLKFASKKGKNARIYSSDNIEILDELKISPDNSIVIVKVKAQIMMLGIAQGSISLIKEFDEDEYPYAPSDKPKRYASSTFSEALGNSLRSFGFGSKKTRR